MEACSYLWKGWSVRLPQALQKAEALPVWMNACGTLIGPPDVFISVSFPLEKPTNTRSLAARKFVQYSPIVDIDN